MPRQCAEAVRSDGHAPGRIQASIVLIDAQQAAVEVELGQPAARRPVAAGRFCGCVQRILLAGMERQGIVRVGLADRIEHEHAVAAAVVDDLDVEGHRITGPGLACRA